MFRPGTEELLEGSDNRFRLTKIINYISVNGTNAPDDIRAMFQGDFDVLNYIVQNTMEYIKARTLSNEETCTLDNIASFLDDLVQICPDYEIDTARLAFYIVVNVLQNNGKLMEYSCYNSTEKKIKRMSIRLIDEEKGSYHLTDDAFDFLYRTKEVTRDIDYSVTRFKMQEYMRRKNYSQALKQSWDLIAELRNMSHSIKDFELRCRENILKITTDEYDRIVGQYRSLLNDELKQLEELKKTVEKEEQIIKEAYLNGADTEDTNNNLKAIQEIIKNLDITIVEQRALINSKDSVSKTYEQLLRESFTIKRYERLNFDRDIMQKIYGLGDKLGDAVQMLFYPLLKPELKKMLNIEDLYVSYDAVQEKSDERGVELRLTDMDSDIKAAERNEIHNEIFMSLFAYIKDNASFTIKKYIHTLTEDELRRWCKEGLFENVLMTLYQMNRLDIRQYKNQRDSEIIVEPRGDFDILYSLYCLPEEYLSFDSVIFGKNDEKVVFSVNCGEETMCVEMTNVTVEVEDYE